jgi:flagellar biosynthetic protein FlhB
MAEENDAASRSEEATPRKLEEARKRGDVAKSFDIPSVASLAAAAGFIAIAGGWLARQLASQLTHFVAHPDTIDLANGGGILVMRQAALAAAPLIVGVTLAAGLAGAAGNLIQHGFLFTPDKLKPDPSRLSPAQGVKRIFGLDGLVMSLKSLLKIAFVSAVAWFSVRSQLGAFQMAVGVDPGQIIPLAALMIRGIFMGVVSLLAAGAAIDWLWQRHRFLTRMRMTREELKEDFRQSEGDPHVRARLRQIRYERARRRMIQNVPKRSPCASARSPTSTACRWLRIRRWRGRSTPRSRSTTRFRASTMRRSPKSSAS